MTTTITGRPVTAELRHLASTIEADNVLARELLTRQLAAYGGPDESRAASAVADAIVEGELVATLYAANAASCIAHLTDRVATVEAQLRALGHTPLPVAYRAGPLNVTSRRLEELVEAAQGRPAVSTGSPAR